MENTIHNSNWGSEAILKGKSDCDNIFKLHGLSVIRKIARFSIRDKDDYCVGKIWRAQEILSQHNSAKNTPQ